METEKRKSPFMARNFFFCQNYIACKLDFSGYNYLKFLSWIKYCEAIWNYNESTFHAYVIVMFKDYIPLLFASNFSEMKKNRF